MTPRDEAAGDGPPEPGGRGDPPRPWELPSDDHSTVRADDSADDDLLPDLRAGDEPVPGYRLVARLGAGATGVVWEAVGPGGFPSALKFTRLGAKRAHELGSLELVRGLRHAHLLPVFGAWERDGYLVVGMELADETLADRLARATASGLPGIPFPELVEYMGQAARGIDYLNGPGRPGGGPGVRHCDIKPQNLLLVGDTVKVGDFGLARTDSEPGSDSARESLTPAFAAPELARNRPTDRSDQYSLAVTYVLLRGGRLPFAGTAWSMLMDHAATPPDLSMLPVSERPVVARALAKRPEDRWADCRQFVRELARVAGSETPPPRKPRRRLVPVAAAGLLAAGLVLGAAGWDDGRRLPDGPAPTPRVDSSAGVPVQAEPTVAVAGSTAAIPEPRLLASRPVAAVDPRPLVLLVRDWADGVNESGTRAARGLAGAARGTATAAADLVPVVRLPIPPVALISAPRAVLVAVAPPPRAAPRTATIRVRMPAADAELVVRGEVGRGNPDEWYGATRVIHTPPLAGPADYLVGAFWTGPDGRALAPRAELRVEPGRVYEVVLRGPQPTTKDVTDEPTPDNRGPR